MDQKLIDILKNEGVAIIPTDTIYGIVGSALKAHVVKRIYQLRKRSANKPMIILISDLNDLNQFSIKLTDKQKEFLHKIWPNPVSVILSIHDEKFKYLHRGKNSLAFRMPKDERLLEILKNTGPLVAPSANFEGDKVAENIEDAKKYFGNNVAFYLDAGKIKSVPSTLIKLKNDGSYIILRQGNFRPL